jgi:hypothetical protein
MCKKELDYYFDTFYGEGCEKREVFFCSKLDVALHPPSVEKKGNAIDFNGDPDNVPMKKECAYFDSSN